MRPIRFTVFMTHPIQYFSPWFRFIHAEAPEIDLHVIYASEPLPEQQGIQFGESFVWDVPLREGYRNDVLQRAGPGHDFASRRFLGIDAPKAAEAIEASKPDVVLSSGWNSVSLLRAMLGCRRRRIPLIYRGDSHLGNGKRRPFWRARTKWLLGRFDQYLSVGTRAREYLTSFGVRDEAIHRSPHAVDNAFFERSAAPFRTSQRCLARAELRLAKDDFVVLYVGKLEPAKRVEDLVRALDLTKRSGVLLVAGSGHSELACRELATEVGVDVRWAGFMNQSELGRAYGISDCLVLPSESETWGLVVNEAMATGLPAIVSDAVGCAPDLIESGRTGEIFPVGDVRALADALDRVRADETAAEWCRRKVSGHSFRAATDGLLTACRAACGRIDESDARHD